MVSSPTGAVIHDIMNVSLRRDPQARILLCPVRVQGIGAADEVVQAIRLLEKIDSVSVIIVARGGGSMEDLWTFNEESVVRAVAACKKPVVSAVGHETDVTLCDLAADLRAPTPSAAAECVTPMRSETLAQIAGLREALTGALGRQTEQKEASLRLLEARLSACRPRRRLDAEAERLAQKRAQLRQAIGGRLSLGEAALAQRRRELDMLSPYRVLARGYAIVTKEGGAVRSSAQVAGGDVVAIRFASGTADARILSSQSEEG